MKPFIKWQGGKRRELANIKPYVSEPVAEPFCGGAAVAFDAQGKAYLNDQNKRLINLYQVVASNQIVRLLSDIEQFKQLTPDELNARYYQARDYINTQSFDDPYVAAREFLFIRQQCFSGMERYNSKGEYNVPHGRYKTFSCCLSMQHHDFLKDAVITNLDAVEHIKSLPPDVFIFIDPPYLERAGYEDKDGGLSLHTKLFGVLATISQPWLIVHSDHEFYRDTYSRFNIDVKPYKYSQQFNGGEYDSKVNHLYISNAT